MRSRLHERGVVHQELAPENVLVSQAGEGQVLLGDFGVANSDPFSGLLNLAGPIEYMAPEGLADEPLTPASNVYSLACILVECLTGSPPYSSEVPGMLAYAHATEPPPRLSERRPDLTAAIDDLIPVAMAKDPEERVQSPRWLVTAAAAALGLEPPRVRSDPRPVGSDHVAAPVRRSGETSRLNGASAEATAAGRRAVAEIPATRETSRRLARLKRPALNSALARGLGLIFVAIAAASGFVLARSDDEDRRTGAAAAVDRAQLRAERERASALRATEVSLERLATRLRRGRRQLTTARTARAQAAAAAELAGDYRAATRTVPDRPPDARRLIQALSDAGGANRRLAARVRDGDRLGYAIAARSVSRAETDVQEAIAALSQARR